MNDINVVKEIYEKFKTEVNKVIIGQEDIIELIFAALLTKGHVLMEGVPGTAKTLLIKSISHIIGRSFKRIQFTPDLMPSDIIGINIYDMKSGEFKIQQGPIFSDFVLADEINRAPAKTQSAMLEAMAERQVTIEGHRITLPSIFTVLATQNPLEYEGTYPLPEAQLDRFLFKLIIPYPSIANETLLLQKFESGFRSDEFEETGIRTIIKPEVIAKCQEMVKQVKTKDEIINYIIEIVNITRNWGNILTGGGPRSSIGLLIASKAIALLDGRDFVTPDDVKKIVCPVLRHRIILKPETEIEGISPDQCLKTILSQVKVPR